jgi:hypothetical protein
MPPSRRGHTLGKENPLYHNLRSSIKPTVGQRSAVSIKRPAAIYTVEVNSCINARSSIHVSSDIEASSRIYYLKPAEISAKIELATVV